MTCVKCNLPDNLIDNTCSCKNKIHIECLVELVKKTGNTCVTCNCSNESVVCPSGIIIFPSKDIYQSHTGTYEILSHEYKFTRLLYALAYLQYDRVKELLNDFTRDEYIEYYHNTDYSNLHSRNKETNALTLKDTLTSHLTRNLNKEDFEKVEAVLEACHKKFL